MAEVSGTATIAAPQATIWDYMEQIDNWIAELQGYVGHSLEQDGSIVVQLRGEIGFMTKVSRLKVMITERQAPQRLAITLKGLNDPLKGDGEVITESAPDGSTSVRYRLALVAHGIAAPVLNQFLDRVVPEAVGDLGQRLVDRLSKGHLADRLPSHASH